MTMDRYPETSGAATSDRSRVLPDAKFREIAAPLARGITQRIHIGVETAQARPKADRIMKLRDTLLRNGWTSIGADPDQILIFREFCRRDRSGLEK